MAGLLQYGNNQSEDCLTLNIWTKPQVGEKAKAVLVWIYGGGEYPINVLGEADLCIGFSFGSSNNLAYNGQHIAENQDVVVVTFK